VIMAAIFTIEMINFLVPFLPGFDALKDLAFSDSHTGHAKQVCHVLCPRRVFAGPNRLRFSTFLMVARVLCEGQPITEGPLNRKDH